MKSFKSDIPSSEITPEHVYLNRRKFMRASGLAAVGTLLAACSPQATQNDTSGSQGQQQATTAPVASSGEKDELGDPVNTWDQITNYNNYYEFTTDKEGIGDMGKNFKSKPWSVQVGGMVNKPQTFALEDLIKKFQPEERIYRHRCVEAWSMVMPWTGFPLAKLLNEVEPTNSAKFVAFTTLMDASQFPGQNDFLYPWPYTEGLRMDEAMNDLALLVTGLYGKDLPVQDGAPIRLAVPWKYGFKSIKAIIKIDLVDKMPVTMWNTIASNEYGFYANVNPNVDHPRWSQATERRIGEFGRRKTLMFNGYGDKVAQMYTNMDLKANY